MGPQGPAGPSGTVIPFSLAPGASSAPITAAADTPVFIVANSTPLGDRGTAFMSLEHWQGTFLQWTGTNAGTITNPTPTPTGGFSSNPGTVMLTFDNTGVVSLQVAGPDSFVIHNGGLLGTQTGVIWVLTAPQA
jgi:hypothetical protein